ncbi:MAG: right-handed parallel beta-helix repeat-containing protein [Prolixibacteraceae bacterium]|nr:right-handed parallel beta-helix repeat-containing protein [Prolixibacteraceae bacterium]
MIKKLAILLLGILPITIQLAVGQKTSFLIGPEIIYLDGNDAAYNEVGPGDTLYFAAGNRKYLLIKNFKGSTFRPIVMINSGGAVTIDTDHYFGISIQNCSNFKFTGTGDPGITYGFQIKRVANGGGMGIGELSTNFEIEHVSIENCMIGGIYAKTDPDCTLASVRGTFTQYNTSIHDNYIANVGDEGLYVGNTKYFGQTVQCDGKDVLLMPSLLDGVRIYNNIIKYSGWDGIQVSSASNDCQIYNNTVLYDSQLQTESQMSGITIGGGSKCDCYNNFISQGKGNGIESHGLGEYKIFNNIILDAGRSFRPTDLTQMKHGIFVTDVSVQADAAFYILHNNIINPKSEGIRFSSVKSKGSQISSNVIINPGNFDYYENDNTSFKGKDSYIMFQYTASDATMLNNYLARNADLAGFVSPDMQLPNDFKLTKGSPLIDVADESNVVGFDFSGILRPYGAQSDVGAFEYDGSTSSLIQPQNTHRKSRLLQNPVKDQLKISIQQEFGFDIYLEIFNLQGVNVLQQSGIKPEKRIAEVNVSHLVPGIYIYLIRSEKLSESGKFIIL